MTPLATNATPRFTRSRLAEIVLEAGLAAGAAAGTLFAPGIVHAQQWSNQPEKGAKLRVLSIGAWAIAPGAASRIAAAQAADATHVTLPTVVIVGRRDALDGTPVATTAQNTAANPVTLNQ
jgi:hypothetical protein